MPIVKKMEFFPAASPVTTGTFKSRTEARSSLKVIAKLFKVGGMRVSPSVLTVFWYLESTTIDFTDFSEKVPVALETSNGTVGIPSHLAAAECQPTILRSKQDSYSIAAEAARPLLI